MDECDFSTGYTSLCVFGAKLGKPRLYLSFSATST